MYCSIVFFSRQAAPICFSKVVALPRTFGCDVASSTLTAGAGGDADPQP